jgi:hypothetical protein
LHKAIIGHRCQKGLRALVFFYIYILFKLILERSAGTALRFFYYYFLIKDGTWIKIKKKKKKKELKTGIGSMKYDPRARQVLNDRTCGSQKASS